MKFLVSFFSLCLTYRKYEEMCAPCMEEICSITDNTYTKGAV